MERADLKKFELPDYPGVYLFKKGSKVLYVGKATSLRDRVRSYFDDDLIATRGPRLVDMVTQADRIAHESTPTVLEALVREAALIREYDPPANSMGKDDKSFLYAVITDEEIPRVLAFRGTDIDFKAKVVIPEQLKVRETFGPFTSGYQLREGLRLIRRIFPFYDTDKPLMLDVETGRVIRASGNKHHQAKVEFNRQIGQYPYEFDKKEYARSIRRVGLFLSGKTKELRTLLNREMKEAAADERFEDAAEVRGQLFSLDHIQDVSLIKEDRGEDKDSPRIEAYDTAHLGGTNAIGVMVVIDAGIPVKKDYRTFRIKGTHAKAALQPRRKVGVPTRASGNDDIGSLKELISRRLPHTEWPYPKAIVVDGGKTHKKAAEDVLKEAGVFIPVVAVVKDEKHRPREVLGSARAGVKDADVVLANAEAHRFSLNRHRRARSRQMRA